MTYEGSQNQTGGNQDTKSYIVFGLNSEFGRTFLSDMYSNKENVLDDTMTS